jgi:hypothetical protein
VTVNNGITVSYSFITNEVKLKTDSVVARSTVVEQTTHFPKIEGSNPATGTERYEKAKGLLEEDIVICTKFNAVLYSSF